MKVTIQFKTREFSDGSRIQEGENGSCVIFEGAEGVSTPHGTEFGFIEVTWGKDAKYYEKNHYLAKDSKKIEHQLKEAPRAMRFSWERIRHIKIED